MSTLHRVLWVLSIQVVSIGLDQWTKWLAVKHLMGQRRQSFWDGIFRLQYAENSGSMLSLGAEMPEAVRFGVFQVGVGLMLLVMLGATIGMKRWERWEIISLALVVSGGIGNWIDRITQDGVVVDFMNIGIGSVRTGIFNVADIAIFAGMIMLLLHAFWPKPRAQDATNPQDNSTQEPQTNP